MDKKRENLKKRHRKIRSRVVGISQKPRLQVFRSLNYTYAQLIDDTVGKTIVATSDMKENDSKGKESKKGNKVDSAFDVGERLAKLAKEQKITEVVFDRRGYLYHGRVKAVAEGARKGGLKF